MNSPRILVTGADGFLGRSTVRRLKAAGQTILTLSRRPDGGDGIIHCDLRSTQDAWSMLGNVRPDVIVNLAAQVDFTAKVPNDLFSVNSMFPVIAAQYASAYGAWIVQASGTIVHGSHHRRIGEFTREQPDGAYGLSKLIADKAIIDAGCGFSILRFGGIFGVDGPSHLKLNGSLREALFGVSPTLFGQGIALRNYIYVEDAARAIEYCVCNRPQGVFYCGGYTLSIRDMLEAVSRELVSGAELQYAEGVDGSDQLVEISAGMPTPLTFDDALRNIRHLALQRGSTPC